MKDDIRVGDTVTRITGKPGEMEVIQVAPTFVICQWEGEPQTFNPWELKIVRMKGQDVQ